jgi:hypothetical protein
LLFLLNVFHSTHRWFCNLIFPSVFISQHPSEERTCPSPGLFIHFIIHPWYVAFYYIQWFVTRYYHFGTSVVPNWVSRSSSKLASMGFFFLICVHHFFHRLFCGAVWVSQQSWEFPESHCTPHILRLLHYQCMTTDATFGTIEHFLGILACYWISSTVHILYCIQVVGLFSVEVWG